MSFDHSKEVAANNKFVASPDLSQARHDAFGIGTHSHIAPPTKEVAANDTYVYPLRKGHVPLNESVYGPAVAVPAGTDPLTVLKIQLGIPTDK